MIPPLDANSTLQQVVAHLRSWREPAWLVGGTVRDRLLGRPIHDIDLAVPAGGLRLAQALADALGAAYFPLDRARDVGRVVVRMADGTSFVIDVARLRGPNLEADLWARDFSINAMACDVHDPDLALIDPTGGQADLLAGQLRAASPQAFVDDALRIVRGARLATQFQLTWEPATRIQARLAAPNLTTISGERIRDELMRLLSGASASQGVRQLDDLDALAVLLPEVKALQGVTQYPPHRLDVYDHTLAVMDWRYTLRAHLAPGPDRTSHHEAASPLPDSSAEQLATARAGFDEALTPFAADLIAYLRVSAEQGYTRDDLLPWAALLHDIGKPRTRQVQPDGSSQFAGHEAAGSVLAQAVLQRLRFSRTAIHRVVRVCATHDQPGALARASDAAVDRRARFLYFKRTDPVGVETALLSLADHLAAWGPNLRPQRWRSRVRLVFQLLDTYFRQYDQVVAPAPLLDGTTLMAALQLEPGPAVGAYLAALQEEQAAGAVQTLAEAWAFVRAQPR